ncbi:MAG TPA: sigma-70 family RNA polymerase sigma factor [Steroidobacteraceae bacterium]
MVDKALNSWFAGEILVHEAALVRYLKRIWPQHDEILDLRQEIYVRVYEAAKQRRPNFPKSFLFSTARHLITDKVRRARVVCIEAAGDLQDTNVLIDDVSPERRLHARQELKQLSQAFGLLPPRCREVVWLRKVDGIPQNEVAQRLNISRRTVECQVQKGMRILAQALFGAEAEDVRSSGLKIPAGESEDGIR